MYFKADIRRWASRAINDMPTMVMPHVSLTCCLVGAGEIDKARAVFAPAQKLAPEHFKIRLDGSPYSRPEDRARYSAAAPSSLTLRTT